MESGRVRQVQVRFRLHKTLSARAKMHRSRGARTLRCHRFGTSALANDPRCHVAV